MHVCMCVCVCVCMCVHVCMCVCVCVCVCVCMCLRHTYICTVHTKYKFNVLQLMCGPQLQDTQKMRQYHYNAWPDHLKPTAVYPIIRMIEVVHEQRTRHEVPIVVHCSAGCGQTGTIIAIDILRSIILNKVLFVARICDCDPV